MSDTALERPDWACLLCPPPSDDRPWKQADQGWRTCEACVEKLRDEVLADIRIYYRRLDPTPGANQEAGGRGAPGFGSKPGAQLHVVSMRDRRSLSYEVACDGIVYDWAPDPDGWSRPLPTGVHGPVELPGAYTVAREVWFGADGRPHSEQTRPPRSIPKALSSLAAMIAEDRSMAAPTGTVDDLTYWIDVQLDYVTRQEWVADVAEELRSLRAQLKPYAGEGRKNKILDCPAVLDEGQHTRVCGSPLYEPNRAGVIRCHACKNEWPRDKWHGTGPGYLSQVAVDSRPRRTA